MKVFISHRSGDQRFGILREAIQTQLLGVECWDPSTLSPGVTLQEAISEVISRCSLCVFIGTRDSLKSSWCHAELGAFWGLKRPVFVYLPDQDISYQDLPPQFRGQLWAESVEKILAGLRDHLQKVNTVSPTIEHHLKGAWVAEFGYTDGHSYREIIDISTDSNHDIVGHIVPSLDNCSHTSSVDHLEPIRMHATLSGADFLTGMWHHTATPMTHGAFQLKIMRDHYSLVGGWLAYSDTNNAAVSGNWIWRRHHTSTAVRFGVYGITCSGKTTLCRDLSEALDNCKYFSESIVIDDYMKRFHSQNLQDFKQLSETDRMAKREAAFRFLSKRVRNSYGIILGDAHFSFPLERLGALEQVHPDAQDGIQPVMPDAAWDIYQAIVYLETPAQEARRRLDAQLLESGRNSWAADLNEHQLQEWIDYEKRILSRECRRRGIQFFLINGGHPQSEITARVSAYIKRFRVDA